LLWNSPETTAEIGGKPDCEHTQAEYEIKGGPCGEFATDITAFSGSNKARSPDNRSDHLRNLLSVRARLLGIAEDTKIEGCYTRSTARCRPFKARHIEDLKA
jgi:hypothetical protein